MSKSYLLWLLGGVLTAGLLLPLQASAEESSAPASKYHRADDLLTTDDAGITRYLEGDTPVTGRFSLRPDFPVGDVNRDGAVDAADAAELLTAAADAGASGQPAAQLLADRFRLYRNAEEAACFADTASDSVLGADDAALILIFAAEYGAGDSADMLGVQEYYADADGVLQTGWIEAADGSVYLADEQFHLQRGLLPYEGALWFFGSDYALAADLTGWLPLSDGKRYVQSGRAVQSQWLLLDGAYSHFDARGVAAVGETEIDGLAVTFTADGKASGWFLVDGAMHYADDNGIPQTGWVDFDDGTRFFDESGVMQTGWLTLDNTVYYLDENGFRVSGLQDIDGTVYGFHETGALLNGWVDFDDGTRYFDENGVMQTGWLTLDNTVYYLDKNGFRVSGLQDIDGTVYGFHETGALLTGWVDSDDGTRYFDESGVMQTGWLTLDNTVYYLDENGFRVSGLQDIDGTVYGFHETGALLTGWVDSDDGTRFFDESGVMQTGWLTLDNTVYYLDENGLRVSGLQDIDGTVYGFHETGALLTGWVDSDDGTRYFDESGVMQTGWLTIGDDRYYFEPETGAVQTGWQELDGGRYYFYEDGRLAVNTEIDGFFIGEDGKSMSMTLHTNKQRAAELLAQYGTSLRGVYNAVRSTTGYKYTESTRTLEQIEANGWLYYVDYAMTHYYGVCYYLAAKMDFLLREAGFTCRIVHSTHGSGDHYWNQIYVDDHWTNYDCTNGLADKTWEQMVAYGAYIFLGYVEPVYL